MRRYPHKITKPLQFARAAGRQLKHILLHKLSRIRNAKNAPIPLVLFWPERPHPYSVAYRILHQLGIKVKQGLAMPSEDELGFLWKDDTFVPPPLVEDLINGSCLNISKKAIDIIHHKIFGYGLTIDPLLHRGKIVIKSD